MIRSVFLFFVFIFLFVCRLASQNNIPLDEYIFPCVAEPEDIQQSICQGARSFIFNFDSENRDTIFQQLRQIPVLLKQADSELVLLAFTGTYNKESLISGLKTIFSGKLFYREGQKEWPERNKLAIQGIRIAALFNEDLSFTSSQRIVTEKTYQRRFTGDPLNKLVVYTPDTPGNLYQNALTLWKKTGKVPNLLLLADDELKGAKAVIDSLNNTCRVTGVILYNNEYMNEIYWKQKPGLVTPGRFCYPILDYKVILSPYKNGYRITPREIIHHIKMDDVTRIFTAYKSSVEDQLCMYFPFDGKVENLMDPQWKETISKDISFINDKKRGSVIHFSRNNSFVDYSKENNLNFDSPVSVAVWVKPDSLLPFMGIIGIGTSFSLKLNKGRPDFTTADIKDHTLEKVLEIKKWQHLAVVFNPNSTIEFFINGRKMSELNASEIKDSRQSLVIGNNIWGEQFYGSLDELMIWDRGLSEKEILDVYLSKNNHPLPNKPGINFILYGFVLILTGSLFFIIIYKKRKRPTTKEPPVIDIPRDNRIELFGNFRVYSKKEGDISTRFSPLLRQIISFFILNVYENGDGVSIKKLNDTFWSGSPKDKTKENRGTNLKKLRKLLDGIPGLTIVYKEKKWLLDFNDQVLIDVIEFKRLKLILQEQVKNNNVDTDVLLRSMEILKKGNLLPEQDAEWLDKYKDNISFEVIELFASILQHLKPLHLRLEVAKTILKFDDLNEQALKTILRILTAQGKHGQARQTYDEFAKRYMLLYNEKYAAGYTEIIRNK